MADKTADTAAAKEWKRWARFEGTNVGKTVRVHYIGTFNDGEQFADSRDLGKPLEFVCGIGEMIDGFDRAVAEMKPGDVIDVHLMPEEAYGEYKEEMIVTVERSRVSGLSDVRKGDRVQFNDELGRPYDAVVRSIDKRHVTFDTNHAMAGKELNFRIEMVEIL